MNQEDKILEILEQIQVSFSGMEARIGTMEMRMKAHMDAVESRMGKMEANIETLHSSVIKIELDYGSQLGGIWDALDTMRQSPDLRVLKKRVDIHEERISSLECMAAH